MNIRDVEESLHLSLKGLNGKIESTLYNKWIQFYQKIKDSAQTDTEKLRQYYILIDAIESQKEAIYRNSSLVIIKDTIVGMLKDVGELPGKILENKTQIIFFVILTIGFLVFTYAKGTK